MNSDVSKALMETGTGPISRQQSLHPRPRRRREVAAKHEMELHDRLRQLRLDADWSQETVIKRMIESATACGDSTKGMLQPNVSKWEGNTDEDREPKIHILKHYARIFEVTMDWLVDQHAPYPFQPLVTPEIRTALEMIGDPAEALRRLMGKPPVADRVKVTYYQSDNGTGQPTVPAEEKRKRTPG